VHYSWVVVYGAQTVKSAAVMHACNLGGVRSDAEVAKWSEVNITSSNYGYGLMCAHAAGRALPGCELQE